MNLIALHHKGKRLFITGIPTSGKSYLADNLAREIGGISVHLDDSRERLSDDERYKQWVNFYINQDERKYLTNTDTDTQWNNLVVQSEALWPAFLETMATYKNEERPVIFECVNMLPHLAKRDLGFPGIVLIGSTYEETLRRNMQSPRWGNTRELQELEAKSFFGVERPHYQTEAEKHGYAVYTNADDAFPAAKKLMI